MDGTGTGLTVTLITPGAAAGHPAGLVKLTLTLLLPVVFQVTPIVLEVLVPPNVIVPPAETDQI